MRRSDFSYTLPASLIAQYPLPERGASRLLMLEGDSGTVKDRQFKDLSELLMAGDVLVCNDTRVIRARLTGNKESGGRVEVVIERIQDAHHALAHVRASRTPRAGTRLYLGSSIVAEVCGRQEDLFELVFHDDRPLHHILESEGRIPLPPYITREDEDIDAQRYQTVYAREEGAVAAPTAGLHLDDSMIGKLADRGIHQVFITLHVGAGTFQPVRCEDIGNHRMHAEYVRVDAAACETVRAARQRGGRVVAVGTTTMRALEAASANGSLEPLEGETDIFIRPGYTFHTVDAMVTNFHLPESTLLMLVCAFGGYGHVMAAYRHAVREHYRFFSYGDAMLVTRQRSERGGDT